MDEVDTTKPSPNDKGDADIGNHKEAWLSWPFSSGATAIIISVITGVTYIVGLISHQKISLELGISSSMFPRSPQATLSKAFFPLAKLVIMSLPMLLILAFAARLWESWSEIKEHIKQWSLVSCLIHRFSWIEPKKNPETKERRNLADILRIKDINDVHPITKVMLKPLIFVFLSIALITIIILSYLVAISDAKDEAKHFIDDCVDGKAQITEVTLGPQEPPMCGCRITCNANQCAYLVVSEFGFGPRLTTVVVNNDGRIHSKVELKEAD